MKQQSGDADTRGFEGRALCAVRWSVHGSCRLAFPGRAPARRRGESPTMWGWCRLQRGRVKAVIRSNSSPIGAVEQHNDPPDPLFLGPFPPPVGQQGDHRLRLNWWVLYLLHFSLSVVLRVSFADAAKFRTPFLSRVDTMTSILTRAPVRACLRTAAPVASASISTCAVASNASTRLALELQRQRRCRLPATRGMASSTTAESQQKVAHSHQDRAQDTGS